MQVQVFTSWSTTGSAQRNQPQTLNVWRWLMSTMSYIFITIVCYNSLFCSSRRIHERTYTLALICLGLALPHTRFVGLSSGFIQGGLKLLLALGMKLYELQKYRVTPGNTTAHSTEIPATTRFFLSAAHIRRNTANHYTAKAIQQQNNAKWAER